MDAETTVDLDGTRTPPAYFEELTKHYHFVCDLFAQQENALCFAHFDRKTDALSVDWPRLTSGPHGQFGCYGWNYGNPPYSRGHLEPAVRKAIEQAKKGSGIVYLIPATTGTAWFNDLILRPCDVLDGYCVDNPTFSGYCLSMSGIGYRQKVTFLKSRVPFLPPIGYPPEKKWDAPATDSVLIEWQSPLR